MSLKDVLLLLFILIVFGLMPGVPLMKFLWTYFDLRKNGTRVEATYVYRVTSGTPGENDLFLSGNEKIEFLIQKALQKDLKPKQYEAEAVVTFQMHGKTIIREFNFIERVFLSNKLMGIHVPEDPRTSVFVDPRDPSVSTLGFTVWDLAVMFAVLSLPLFFIGLTISVLMKGGFSTPDV